MSETCGSLLVLVLITFCLWTKVLPDSFFAYLSRPRTKGKSTKTILASIQCWLVVICELGIDCWRAGGTALFSGCELALYGTQKSSFEKLYRTEWLVVPAAWNFMLLRILLVRDRGSCWHCSVRQLIKWHHGRHFLRRPSMSRA